MRILITGGAGFIGSHIQDQCIVEKHQVAVVDSLRTGLRKNLHPKSVFFKTDIRHKNDIQKIFAKFRPEVVFHTAAQVDVQYSLSHPVEDAEINILGTLNVLDAAQANTVKTFVYSHSGGAYYGNVPKTHFPIKEDEPESFPISPYGISKLAAERYLQFFADEHDIRWISLRYSNVYGPRQKGSKESGVFPLFIESFIHQTPSQIFGKGDTTRDYIYVHDVVSANLLAMKVQTSGYCNISTGVATSTLALHRLIAKHMHSHIPPKFFPARKEIRFSCLSPQYAHTFLGWSPRYTLQRGLQETIAWYLDHGNNR